MSNIARKSTKYREIEEKVQKGVRITNEDALYLFENASLSQTGFLANIVNERKSHGRVYFNRNFHMEPTNVCVYSCNFCSYSRLIKERGDGWELTMDEMMEQIYAYDDKPVTLTPVEYHYIFKKDKISYAEGMKLMKEAGLDSIPGGGAEIFHPEIRMLIAKDKCTGEQWLDIHREWHKLGMRSNATMLYGHIENYFHRVDHLAQLRDLQDETGGFQTFIPLKFLNENNQMSDVPMTSIIDDMKTYAISRIYLDNFDHLKAYWPMLGREMAQLSLAFGVDDLDGTIDDTTKIYSMAGSEEKTPALTTQELVKMILDSHKIPVERDTLYHEVKVYSASDIKEEIFNKYVQLPVI